jgi:diacylglycerol kinase (ATP)
MFYAVVDLVILDETLRLMSTSEASLSLLWLLQCDGTDLTPKIQDLKFQCIVFLNIPR